VVDTSEVDDFAMKGAFSVAKETTMWTPLSVSNITLILYLLILLAVLSKVDDFVNL